MLVKSFIVFSEMCGDIVERDFHKYNFENYLDGGSVSVEPDYINCDGCDDSEYMKIYPAKYEEGKPIDCSWYDTWRDQTDEFEARA